MKWPSLLRFESANTLAGLELVRQQKRLGNTALSNRPIAIALVLFSIFSFGQDYIPAQFKSRINNVFSCQSKPVINGRNRINEIKILQRCKFGVRDTAASYAMN